MFEEKPSNCLISLIIGGTMYFILQTSIERGYNGYFHWDSNHQVGLPKLIGICDPST